MKNFRFRLKGNKFKDGKDTELVKKTGVYLA